MRTLRSGALADDRLNRCSDLVGVDVARLREHRSDFHAIEPNVAGLRQCGRRKSLDLAPVKRLDASLSSR
ncbi:MAG: hypothetical protein ACR2GX_06665 [Candidatus Dormibacteria bacterium]